MQGQEHGFSRVILYSLVHTIREARYYEKERSNMDEDLPVEKNVLIFSGDQSWNHPQHKI